MKTSILFILCFLCLTSAFAQSRYSIGIQGGPSRLIAETVEVPNQLTSFEARGSDELNMLLYGRYHFLSKLSLRIGGGIIGLGRSSVFEDIKSGNSSYPLRTGFSRNNFQLMTAVDYSIPFGSSNWGSFVSLGFNAIFSNFAENQDFTVESEDGIRGPGIFIRNELGEVSQLLIHSARYQTFSNQVFYHLRPEIGLYKKFSKHMAFLSFVYGHALTNNFSSIDFHSISFAGENYSAKHRFNGSFAALQLGYEYRF